METERPPRRQQQPPELPAAVAVAAAVAMSTVLGDENLLREILLRVCLPGTLLRAALVCKRWLRHAAEPAFLRQFRARHCPYLIGAYLSTTAGGGGATSPPRFLPIQLLPREFAAAARRAGSFFDALLTDSSASIRDSRGGRLLVTTHETNYGQWHFTHQVCRPLSSSSSAREDAVVVVPLPTPPLPRMVTDPEVEPSIVYYQHEFLPNDDSGGCRSASYSCVLMGYSDLQTTVHLYELKDWFWVLKASAAAQIRVSPPRSKVVLVDENRFYFYMLSTINRILVCDFHSSSISAMELPDGVEEGHTGRIMLSRGDGSATICLIHVEESQLRVFRSDNAGSCWTLQNRISLHELRAALGIADRPPVEGNGAGVKIHAVGDNATFVFLVIVGAVVFLDITSNQANKIYEMAPEEELVGVHPLTLKCPHVSLRYPLKEPHDN